MLPLALALAALTGCRGGAFSSAAKANTIADWRTFLREHPTDENADAAKERLSDLEFAQAQGVHTVLGYKRFLEEFPDSSHGPAARALLEGIRFNAAQAKGAAVALRQFLREHPDGAHHLDAEALLGKAEVAELAGLEDATALQQIAAAHPDDAQGAQAGQRLDEHAWAAAATPAQWLGYLRDFPAGAHRDEARVKLLDAQLEGLLVSGELERARAVVAKAPLSSKLPRLAERLKHAELLQAVGAAKDDAVARALPGYYLRSLEDLVKSLGAPDPLERWQAAEELGEHVTVASIDPLLEAFRTARNPLVRQRAFESLGRVLKALPRVVAEYEVATRVEAASVNAVDAQLFLTIGALLDLTGRLDRAASEYQKAFDPAAPDPILMRRWAQIRRERRQAWSAAVAARQLSVWAERVAQVQAVEEGTGALGVARQLCAAVELSRWAREVIAESATQSTEFPDDVAEFQRRAVDAVKLAEARLRDAELRLLENEPRAKRCGDDSVRERIAAGEKLRLEAIRALPVKAAKVAGLARELALLREPSPAIREAVK